MFYREAGQFRTTYAQDSQLLPLRQDRVGMAVLLAIAFIGIPLFADDYWLSGILIPWLILSLVALGQNILMGYAGQLSLGSAGFMAVGAFACYNLILRIDGIPFFVAVALSGVCAAVVGIFFGLPSLRIRGLYLAVTTLAAQFFIVWAPTNSAGSRTTILPASSRPSRSSYRDMTSPRRPRNIWWSWSSWRH